MRMPRRLQSLLHAPYPFGQSSMFTITHLF
jgi:hypothetical protein